MSGALYKLGEMPFAATDTVFYQHNLNREQVGVMVIANGEQQNANITSVELSPTDPRNALTVRLDAPMTGVLLLVDSDYVWSAIPTPEEKAGLQSTAWFGADVAVAGPSALQQTTSSFVYLTAATLVVTYEAGADYRVDWTINLSQDTSSGIDYRLTWVPPGGGTVAASFTNTDRQPRQWNPRSSFFHITGAAAGVHTFTLSFKAARHNRNVRASQATLTSWRVA